MINDNIFIGPAFPQPCCSDGRSAHGVYNVAGGGITILDYFAAKAMQELIGKRSAGSAFLEEPFCSIESVAITAYKYAEEMVKHKMKIEGTLI